MQVVCEGGVRVNEGVVMTCQRLDDELCDVQVTIATVLTLP